MNSSSTVALPFPSHSLLKGSEVLLYRQLKIPVTAIDSARCILYEVAFGVVLINNILSFNALLTVLLLLTTTFRCFRTLAELERWNRSLVDAMPTIHTSECTMQLLAPADSSASISIAEPTQLSKSYELQPSKDIAYKQGYQSLAFPLLASETPTDTLPESERSTLSKEELQLLERKKEWLASKHPQKLAEIVTRVVKDRDYAPVTNVVCLGIGEKSSDADYLQFVAVLQIVAQLAITNPDILNNLCVQDPAMTAGKKAMFENHGFKVVDHPAAFLLVDRYTALFEFHLCLGVLCENLQDRPTTELAMYIGNMWSLVDNYGSNSEPLSLKTFDFMLDHDFCRREDMPCDRPYGKRYDFGGLSALEVWWRPSMSMIEKVEARYEAAVKLGFPECIEDFSGACAAGFSAEFSTVRKILVYRYIATRHLDSGGALSFAEYYNQYHSGSLEDPERYDSDYKRWKSILRDPNERDRSWVEYLDGDKALEPWVR
ncbi:hypothetical protein VTL71DRAFT_6712 [Oculimacula yallundae]|uniref:SRR1-like domain-containing protein n=1 Tax=Oculimacula yallundae TaxID=86028 RepID=A0ABR4BZA1_9HELO